jgi:septum formation protein
VEHLMVGGSAARGAGSARCVAGADLAIPGREQLPVRLVLASSSPRRRELLGRLGVAFDVVPSAVEESLRDDVPAEALARDLAVRKARDVAGRLHPAGGRAAVVLGADTLVVLDGCPIGKPGSRADARAMLRSLAGRSHEVVTAVALVEVPPRREVVEAVMSRVVMRACSEAAIEAYLSTDEPYDKAGAYAVQGAARDLILRVEGCYTNVVGLPITTTARLLRAFGFTALEPPGLTAGAASDRGEPGRS